MNQMLLVEFNEFNSELTEKFSRELELQHIQKVLSLRRIETFTADTDEGNALEPWVQWVSVHTGVSSNAHGIQHLGDVPDLAFPQLWEALSDKGWKVGVWGPMNASKGTARNCGFFLPDPWMVSERAHPEKLNAALELAQYFSKNYLQVETSYALMLLTRFLWLIRDRRCLGEFLLGLGLFLKGLLRFGPKHFVVITFFDYLSASLFVSYKQEVRPHFSLFFMNSLAHLQHHHWRSMEVKDNPELAFGFRLLDRIFGMLLKSLGSGEKLVVANALSQKNTAGGEPWILYRQRDQASFLKSVGITFAKVEPHMTHDAHLFFESEHDKEAAWKALSEARIEGRRLFHLERYENEPLKLFYRIDYTNVVPKGYVLEINGHSLNFFDLFKEIVVRTGRHIPQGAIYTDLDGLDGDGESLPRRILNHELSPMILRTFDRVGPP